MQWDSGQIFEILAIGNGYFMTRVFMALSMMWSSGLFASIGALGLLIGLLAMGASTVASGGQRMDMASLFTGFILWAVMFAGGASVQITEVGFMRPGSTGANSWVVDDVPLGVAATGWVISTVGKEITEKMEQAYGMVGEEQSVLKTGPGRSLEWLASVRLASDINIGSNDNQFSVMRANLLSYMRYCSIQAVVRDPDRAATMPYAPEPLNVSTGFGFESEWVTTDWYTFTSPGAKPTVSEVNCTIATERLNNYFASGSGQAFRDFANTVARPMGYTGESNADQQAVDSAAALNVSLDQAQRYMLGSVISSLWSEAISGSPLLTDQQVANRIMITQAVEQRATEAAGEETIFRKTMYPLMTFLESTFFITAPFMALALGLGRLGLSISMKFALVSLWLAMWLPTLAVINMFQLVSFETAFEGLIRTYTGSDAPYQIGSVAGANHMQSSVLDWLGTGAMLAASTPLISLMFLMGSAYTATSLAGAFKGGDVINERQPTPDAASAPPGIQRTGLMTHSVGAGSLTAGTSLPNLEFSGGNTIEQSRQFQAAEQSITDYAKKEGKQVASAVAQDISAGVRGSDRNESRAGLEYNKALQALQKAGVDMSNVDQDAARLIMAASASGNARGTLSTRPVQEALAQILGDSSSDASVADGGPNRPSKLGRVAQGLVKAVGFDISGEASSKDDVQRVTEGATRLANQIAAVMDSNTGVRAAVTNANAAAAEAYGDVRGSASSRVTGSDEWAKTRRDQSSAQETYSAGQRYSEMGSTRQSIPLGEASREVSNAGMAADAVQSALQTHGAQAFQDAKNNLAPKFGGGSGSLPTGQSLTPGGPELTQLDVAAALSVLNGTAPTDHLQASEIGNGKMEVARLLTSSGALNTSTGTGAFTASAPTQDGLGAEASSNSGSARGEVGGTRVGADAGTEAKARGALPSLQTDEGRAEAKGQLSAWGLPVDTADNGGSRAGGYRDENGGLDTSNFEADSSGVRGEGQGRVDGLQARGQQVMGSRAATNEGNSWRKDGDVSQGLKNLNGMERESTGVSQDNPNVGLAVQQAAEGRYTGGQPLRDDEALVVGSYRAATGDDAALSEGQFGAMVGALENMEPERRAATIGQLGRWDRYEASPDRATVGARSALGRAFSLEDVPTDDSSVGPENSGFEAGGYDIKGPDGEIRTERFKIRDGW